jgi:hypothetical protein
MRDLIGPLQSTAIRDLLQSLLVAETLKPSDPLWILSGWISDIPVIDNSARQFSAIDPDWPVGEVCFSHVFSTLLARGGRIVLILRDDDQNHRFLGKLQKLKEMYKKSLLWNLSEHAHEKGIVGHDFDISGSMNFTFRGIEVNGEHLIYRTDPDAISGRRIILQNQWRELLDD